MRRGNLAGWIGIALLGVLLIEGCSQQERFADSSIAARFVHGTVTVDQVIDTLRKIGPKCHTQILGCSMHGGGNTLGGCDPGKPCSLHTASQSSGSESKMNPSQGGCCGGEHGGSHAGCCGGSQAALYEKPCREHQDCCMQHYELDVEDVRLKVLNFPAQNKEKVFRRMRAERERIARKYRSEGGGEAERIRAQADEEREKIISAAYRQAEEIKGGGDAEARAYRTRVINEATGEAQRFLSMLAAYQADPSAYSKQVTDYRLHLETLEKVLARVKKKYFLDRARDGKQKVDLRFFDEQ